MALALKFFFNAAIVFSSAILLRAGLLLYGHYQDQWSAVKYTDIDYYVFTDAARNVAWNRSPYLRDTYRYTPLLAWALVPTAWPGFWFDFGKAIFAASDVIAGWLIYRILRTTQGMPTEKALKFASIWLLNPMVAQISTRGSSEGLLTVMIMGLLWASLRHRYMIAGTMLGLAVHFKIYPFIYAASIFWWLGGSEETLPSNMVQLRAIVGRLFLPARVMLVASSALTFTFLNVVMYIIYGHEFIEHTFLYHFTRSDHRHNFSPYNMLLYMNSSPVSTSHWHPETLAFLPQILLSAIVIPLALAKRDLASCLLAQTFAFVSFNKVCTSQYFLWYIAFLPFYLPKSSLLKNAKLGITALLLWIGGQAFWLYEGFQLEFLGKSTFVPGLLLASLTFFAVNIWILGIIISDVRQLAPPSYPMRPKKD